MFTHGSPWYFDCALIRSLALFAVSMCSQVSAARIWSLASPSANTVVSVQLRPALGRARIGPNCEYQRVVDSVPPPCTGTVTVRLVIGTDSPSYMYLVGSVGSSSSSNRVKRCAVETVWLQATCLLWPMLTAGKPIRLEPIALNSPGIFSWNSQKRSIPRHGKCGLASTRLLPFRESWVPTPRAFEPILAVSASFRLTSNSEPRSASAASADETCGAAAASGPGGTAATKSAMKFWLLASRSAW